MVSSATYEVTSVIRYTELMSVAAKIALSKTLTIADLHVQDCIR